MYPPDHTGVLSSPVRSLPCEAGPPHSSAACEPVDFVLRKTAHCFQPGIYIYIYIVREEGEEERERGGGGRGRGAGEGKRLCERERVRVTETCVWRLAPFDEVTMVTI